MTLRLSHVLDKAGDLHVAVAAAKEDGFTMAWGSEPTAAHNALVWFDEGPFLEVFVPPDWETATMAPALAERVRRWREAPQGWCDVALETSDRDLTDVLARLRDTGVAMVETGPMSRTNPDGSVVSWFGACPEALDLPFVVSAYSEPQRPARTVHPNGTARVVQAIVASPDPAAYRQRLVALLGTEAAADAWEIVRGAEFAVLGVRLHRADGTLIERMGTLAKR